MYRTTSRIASVATAAAMLCLLAACIIEPHRSDAQKQADRETAERVQAALDGDGSLYAKHITVRADAGVIHLTGYVWDSGDLNEAETIASTVSGVNKVVNDLELQRNGIDNSGVSR